MILNWEVLHPDQVIKIIILGPFIKVIINLLKSSKDNNL